MDDTQKRIAEIREADRQVADGVVKQWMLAGEWPSELPDFIAAALSQARASGYAAGVAEWRERHDNLGRLLRQKDQAMDVLFKRMNDAGVDYSDLIP